MQTLHNFSLSSVYKILNLLHTNDVEANVILIEFMYSGHVVLKAVYCLCGQVLNVKFYKHQCMDFVKRHDVFFTVLSGVILVFTSTTSKY